MAGRGLLGTRGGAPLVTAARSAPRVLARINEPLGIRLLGDPTHYSAILAVDTVPTKRTCRRTVVMRKSSQAQMLTPQVSESRKLESTNVAAVKTPVTFSVLSLTAVLAGSGSARPHVIAVACEKASVNPHAD